MDKNRACLPFPGRQALFHEQSKKGGAPASRMRAGGRPVSGCLILSPGASHARRQGASCRGAALLCHHAGQRSSPSRIMPGDGESRTACATRDLASDPAKSFGRDGEFEGKERPFQKGGSFLRIPLLQLFGFHIGQQLADAVQTGGGRVLETGVELVAHDVFQGSGQPGKRLSARASARVTEERPLRA